MAYGRNDDDNAGDFGPNDTDAQAAPNIDDQVKTYLGQDPQGHAVYRGADGSLYTDGQGTNGFVPYSGPGVGQTAAPTGGPDPGNTGGGDPGTGGGGLGSSGGDLTAPFTQKFQAPAQLNLGGMAGISYIPPAPRFTPPTRPQAPAFSYKDFSAPDKNAVLNDPGYQLRQETGANALMANRAAMGVAGTGGTLKDFLDYNQNFASQEYGNVFNRDLGVYQTNRKGAVDTYNTNYQTQYADPWKADYTSYLDSFAPQMQEWQTQAQAGQHQNDMNQNQAWNEWLQDYNIFRNQELDTFDKRFRTATAE